MAAETPVSTHPTRRKGRLPALIPVCMYCKRVRMSDGRWRKARLPVGKALLSYSHGICPQCEHRLIDDMGGEVPPNTCR